MKKICLLLFGLLLYLFLLPSFVCAAGPHFEFEPASGIISTAGTNINVIIDTAGSQVKSAKAVINFDSSLLEVTSIQAGDFFDDVSNNIYNADGQVVINANLSLGSMLESKTGRGTLAIMTVKAKASSGTANMTFDCTDGSSTDSNINDPTPTDIIVCSDNGNGGYSLAPISSPSPSASPNPSFIPSPSPSSIPSSSPVSSPTPPASPENRIFNFRIKFDGVPANGREMNLPETHRQQTIKISIVHERDGAEVYSGNVVFNYAGNGIWEASLTL